MNIERAFTDLFDRVGDVVEAMPAAERVLLVAALLLAAAWTLVLLLPEQRFRR